MKNLPKLSLITLGIISTSAVYAEQQNHLDLSEVNVVATESKKSLTEIKKSSKLIRDELIFDVRDLVRYTTDVGISDNGRRLKGFSMRGVEGNRVGISIDNVSLPASEENSLYSRYGNFNNSRLSIDSELIRDINIVRGADSLNFGDGAIGGSVNYKTMEAFDLVQEGQSFGGLVRSGYASKNREWVNTLGVGYVNEKFDVALMYSYRTGHETKSAGKNTTPQPASAYDTARDIERRAEIGSARIHPDPSKHKYHNYLAKFGWNILPGHRLGLSITGQDNSNYVDEKSYALTTYWREADDTQKRFNGNLYYEWAPESKVISSVRTDLDYQKIENGAINYKGSYDRVGGSWREGYIYAKGALYNVDNRNLITKYKRASLRIDSNPFELFSSEHRLTLNGYLASRRFENINQDDVLDKNGNINTREVYTIQHPMKTTMYGIGLQDKILFNSIFSGNLGLRYDYTRVQPQNSDIPCGKSSSFGRLCSTVNVTPQTFKNWSGFVGLDAQVTESWALGYQYSSGYRVPTSSEMYFTFESPYGNWAANPNLKAERSFNHTLSLTGKGYYGDLDANVYYSRYRNFLFEKETSITRSDPTCDWYAAYYTGCTGERTDYFQQMVNLEKARIYGLEIKGSLNLDTVTPLPKGFKLFGGVGYSKGKLSGANDVSLLSIQPLKMIFGLDYVAPNDKWGIFSRLTYMRGKKAKDAQIAEQAVGCSEFTMDYYTGQPSDICKAGKEYYYDKVMPYRWLNKSAWVFDLFGFYKPTKNITLRAGVYNLFNHKYHTWDSLRGINIRSTINTVDYRDGNQGLARFYAPGRNYSASIEVRF